MAGITRRAFLRDLGQGTLAVAVLGISVVSCSSEEEAGTTFPVSSTSTSTSPVSTSSTSIPVDPGEAGVVWERVILGSVSAYVLVRRGEAAVVDTGNPGSAGGIEAALGGLGIGWQEVSHVILTHLHNDHVGSLGDVMAAAPAAIGFAGEPDIPNIPSPRPLRPVGDGDTVFGLEVIATPGHTPGSIAVFDAIGGLLVAGDALNGVDGGVAGANPRFSSDMAAADASVRKLAALQFDAVVFGHGEPVVGGASGQVAALAATL